MTYGFYVYCYGLNFSAILSHTAEFILAPFLAQLGGRLSLCIGREAQNCSGNEGQQQSNHY